MNIDLHIHSTMSDGTLAPSEIVDLAFKKGLSAIAITDHDTVAGCEEAISRGKAVGLEVLSGVEVSVVYNGINLHLLGYLVDCENEKLFAALRTIQAARKRRNHRILEKLQDIGISVSEAELNEVSAKGQTGRPHIALVLIKKGYVRSMDEAFEKFIGKEGSCYVRRFVFELEEAVACIHGAGGIAVVAHPYHLLKDDLESGEIIQELKNAGVDGLEAYYPTHGKPFRKQLIAAAKKHGLLVTGGSDYHGDIRKGTTLAGGKGVSVPYELIANMRNAQKKVLKTQ